MARGWFAVLAAPAAIWLALFFALPVAGVAVDAFAGGGTAFARILAAPTFWPSLAGSVLLTLVATTVSTLVGIAVALHLSRMPERPRTLLSFVIALPLTFSGLIVAYGFILAYGRAGFFTQLAGFAGLEAAVVGAVLFTPVGLAFASSYYLIPRVVMLLLPVLVNFDRTQLVVAESLGATPAQAFRQVLLPAGVRRGRRGGVPGRGGRVRRLRHRARARRHPASHPAAAALQPDLRDGLGLSGRRGARAADHRRVLERHGDRRVDLASPRAAPVAKPARASVRPHARPFASLSTGISRRIVADSSLCR